MIFKLSVSVYVITLIALFIAKLTVEIEGVEELQFAIGFGRSIKLVEWLGFIVGALVSASIVLTILSLMYWVFFM